MCHLRAVQLRPICVTLQKERTTIRAGAANKHSISIGIGGKDYYEQPKLPNVVTKHRAMVYFYSMYRTLS